MGCFDTVNASCPSCGGRVSFQSKAGACTLRDFSSHSVPTVIALDLDGEWSVCDECNKNWKIRAVSIPKRVSMSLDPWVPSEEDDDG